ncbi:MobF family relaxase (plasmid) [Nocardia sp. CA-129566]|uniref:MobF family relaxase n=1 Tax=Nocardia sp. CA-129566 TaxID=3239976 RepID=UPI003D96E102
MTLHKLSAGDGYLYYARCIAVCDGDDRGRTSLDDYYLAKGEMPGRWLGSGLVAFADIDEGDPVLEPQMAALYGQGMHPDAEAITARMRAEGASPKAISRAVRAAVSVQPAGRAICRSARKPTPSGTKTTASNRGRLCRRRCGGGSGEVAKRMFEEDFGRPPKSDRELTWWVARNSQPPKAALSAYDLTFSPCKSVSSLWALAPREIAEKIEAANEAAVADVLAFLDENTYTRLGTNGVRQVDTEGLIAAAYTHRDSRAGDPDLHIHLVISNKVRTLDGKWRALDGRLIHQLRGAASEIYDARLEHHLEAALGIEFADRAGRGPELQPIREIVGMRTELNVMWSKRSAMIESKLAELTADFQNWHGREPTPGEAVELAQTATIKTRAPKHRPRSHAEQREAWWAEAVQLLGGDQAVEAMLADVLGRGVLVREQEFDDAWIAETARRVVDKVATRRATWRIHHVRIEVQRQLRGEVGRDQWRQVSNQVVQAAMSPPISIPRGMPDNLVVPDALRRRDGTSQFVVAGSATFTSPQVLAAERRLIDASLLRGGRTISAAAVDVAIVEFAANNRGRQLNPEQHALVEAFATSGMRLQLGIAPAGTGKTTAMQVLVRAWSAEGGTVIGLAPTASAAAVLEGEAGVRAGTIDMLVNVAERVEAGTLDAADAPEWMRDIDAETLVIVDEAAKAATTNLDAAVRFLLDRGASVRLIGDDQQLAAVAAGGIVRDIAYEAGSLTLSRVMRFTDPGERAASLAVRQGDPAALAFYADHDRIHTGAIGAVTEQAFAAWAADTAAGMDSILLAPTRAMVAQLNARARAARLAGDPKASGRAEVRLGDGLAASVGDMIATRKNNYQLRISDTDHVRNGYWWRVRTVYPDGRITVAHTGSGRLVTLPADYVAEHTALGYATTIDTSQGLTVDTCHGVLTGRETRNQLYVMLTRGRSANHAYVATALPDTEPAPFTIEARMPPTYLDVLTGVLGRDGAQLSATSADRAAADPRTRLRHSATAYADAIAAATEYRAGVELLDDIDGAAERLVPGLTDEPAYPTLRQRLSLRAAQGGDPVAILTAAVNRGELDSALDRAAVLDWRIAPTGDHARESGPLPWLPAIPARLRGDPEFGQHLREREQQVRGLAAEVAAAARAWDVASAPMWARSLIGSDPELLGDLAVWRAAQGVADIDRRRTGPHARSAAERRTQRKLERRAARVLGDQAVDVRRWSALATSLDPRILDDPFWPALATEWSRVSATGLDVEVAARAAFEPMPLPAEQPAAALRWRMARDLDEQRGEDAEKFARVVDALRRDALRRMSDAQLADDISSLRNMIWTDQLPVDTEHRDPVGDVQDRHHELDNQATTIHAVHNAEQKVGKAERELRKRGNKLAEIEHELAATNWWQHRGRDEIKGRIATWKTKVEEAEEAVAAAERDLEDAERAVTVPKAAWTSTLQQAQNTGRRDAELANARETERLDDEGRRRSAKILEDNTELLDAAVAEQQRRDDLTDPERDLEDRARTELDEQAEHAVAVSTSAAGVQVREARNRTWAPPTDQEMPAPDFGPELSGEDGLGV